MNEYSIESKHLHIGLVKKKIASEIRLKN